MFGDSKDSALFTVDDLERPKEMGDDDDGALGEADGRSDIFRNRAGTADGPAVLGRQSLPSGAPIVMPRDLDANGRDVRWNGSFPGGGSLKRLPSPVLTVEPEELEGLCRRGPVSGDAGGASEVSLTPPAAFCLLPEALRRHMPVNITCYSQGHDTNLENRDDRGDAGFIE